MSRRTRPGELWNGLTPERLHLDADTSLRQLQRVLSGRGHDVTRTPNDWIAAEADDATQLLAATAQGRVIFTFNVRDYLALAGDTLGKAPLRWRPSAIGA